MANSKDFSGKVALITGSSSGIGEGIAILLSKFGARVVITSRDGEQSSIKRVADLCQAASPQGFKALEVTADVTNDDDCRRLVQATVQEFGQIDILVNNAGASFPTDINDPQMIGKYDRNLALNTRAPVFLTSLCVPYLEKTRGNIINTSSIAAYKPIPPMFAYNMSKSAIDMFTKNMAIELGPKGIRVNSVNPGGVKSNFGIAAVGSAEAYRELEEMGIRASPLKRQGMPDDIAKGVAFLASDDASFITGISLLIDGGSLLGTWS